MIWNSFFNADFVIIMIHFLFFVIKKDDWKDATDTATDALASLIINADDAMIYKLAIDMEIVTIKRHNAKGAHS